MAILSNVNGKFAVDSTGAIQFSGQTGTSGYVLKSNGNAAPTWIPQSDIVGAYLPLAGGTLTGATATASGISLTVGGTLTVNDNISTSADKRVSVGTWDNSAFTGGNAQGFSVQGVTPGLFILETGQTNKKSYLAMSGGGMYLGGSINFLALDTDGARALTLDSSQDATFTGGVTATYYQANNFINVRVDDAEVYWTNSANNDYWVWKRDASNNFILDHYNGSATSNALTFNSSQNATFAGNIYSGLNGMMEFRSSSYNNRQIGIDSQGFYVFNPNAPSGGRYDLKINDSGTATFAKNLTVSDGSLLLNKSDGAFISLLHNSSLKGYLGIANQVITGGSTGDIGLTATTNLIFGSGGTTERMRITSAGDITVSGGDLFLNSGTSYNDKGVVYFSNERTAIISDIVNATANGDTSLDFQTRKGGTRASAMFIDEFRNVGIGTATPNRPLTIQSNSGATALSIYARNQDDYGFIQFFGYNQTTLWSEIAGRPSNLSFYQNSNEVLRLGVSSSFFPSGNVGIGVTNPTAKLQVEMNASSTFHSFFQNNNVSGYGAGFQSYSGQQVYFYDTGGNIGSITSNGSNTSYNTSGSDERLKENIEVWDENVLDKFKNLQPKTFKFIKHKQNNKTIKGYIAQNEVDNFPEAYPMVYDIDAKEDMYQFNPSGMTVYLMKAIQELEARIKILENK